MRRYSHEVVSFGFWAGDENVREPTYYSYTAPEPAGIFAQAAAARRARLARAGTQLPGALPYDAVRAAADPRAALLAFLESAYTAGASLAGWDVAGLTSSWHPGASRT